MSYAEGGTRIPAGKQVPYPGATASSRRWVQLSQSTVFENSLLDRLSAQMVHSHTGFETFCHESEEQGKKWQRTRERPLLWPGSDKRYTDTCHFR